MTDEDEKNEALLSARFNQRVIFLSPMGKREYKNHKNGHGISIWDCRQCGCKMDDILVKFQKPDICKSCSEDNRKLRARLNYHHRKILKNAN